MRTAIDITSVIYGRGVSRYTSNLVRSLADLEQIDLQLFGTSLRRGDEIREWAETHTPHASIDVQRLPTWAMHWAWKFGKLPVADRFRRRPDLIHSWDWMQPPDEDIPLVSTIHDLAMLQFPETADPTTLKRHQRSWKILREREADIIAVSKATKRDIMRFLEIPAERIHVVYEAVPRETKRVYDLMSEETEQRIIKKYRLQRPFLLAVGTREPRKNLERIIQAWDGLSSDMDLLIAGAEGWDDTGTYQSDAWRKKGLHFLGRVSDEVLAVLYETANALVYASLYEGFGLPILESFSHGTPVVASDTSALPEVAGNAAIYVDPHDVHSIRAGIEHLLREDPTTQKKRLQKMIIRLQLFTWERTAQLTAQVYQRAIARKN